MGFLLSALGVNYNLTIWGRRNSVRSHIFFLLKRRTENPGDLVPVRPPLAELSQHCSAGFLGDRCDLGEAIDVGVIHDFAFIISYLKIEAFF